MDEPQLQNLFLLLLCEPRDRLWVLVIIHKPKGVVKGMNGREMSGVVRVSMVEDHGHNAISSFGDEGGLKPFQEAKEVG